MKRDFLADEWVFCRAKKWVDGEKGVDGWERWMGERGGWVRGVDGWEGWMGGWVVEVNGWEGWMGGMGGRSGWVRGVDG